jgi:hypothetical protein
MRTILDYPHTIAANPAGIEFLVTPTGSDSGNTVVKNTLMMNFTNDRLGSIPDGGLRGRRQRGDDPGRQPGH